MIYLAYRYQAIQLEPQIFWEPVTGKPQIKNSNHKCIDLVISNNKEIPKNMICLQISFQ